MLEPQQPPNARDIVSFEGADASFGEDRLHEAAKALPVEVLVTPDESHLEIEARVVAIRLDDERDTARSEHTPVFGERTFGVFHVMERVLRVNEVERLVLERQRFAVGHLKSDPECIAPPRRLNDVYGNDFAHALAHQVGNAAVSAADVEQRLVTSKHVLELVDAPEAITMFARRRVESRRQAAAA
jgi:hypothetical protein